MRRFESHIQNFGGQPRVVVIDTWTGEIVVVEHYLSGYGSSETMRLTTLRQPQGIPTDYLEMVKASRAEPISDEPASEPSQYPKRPE